jgi:spore coat polysaccharide biosynthesis protein SpsF
MSAGPKMAAFWRIARCRSPAGRVGAIAYAGRVPKDLQPIWAIVAGRMGSSRLPGKTLAPLAGQPSLGHIVDRLRRIPALDGVAIATTEHDRDEPIRALAAAKGVPCFSGSEDDVLGRTLAAARWVGARTIVQVTGDCPLVEPRVVERVLHAYAEQRPDYASNVLGEETFPVGLDVEVFATDLLAQVDRRAIEPYHREHVTVFVYEHPEEFRLLGLRAEGADVRPDLRLCIDTAADLDVVSAIYEALFPHDPEVRLEDVIAFLDAHPQIARHNVEAAA